MGKNSGPVLSRLWAKVHEILGNFADGAETAAVDRLLPPPTENIFVSVSLLTLENELMVL